MKNKSVRFNTKLSNLKTLKTNYLKSSVNQNKKLTAFILCVYESNLIFNTIFYTYLKLKRNVNLIHKTNYVKQDTLELLHIITVPTQTFINNFPFHSIYLELLYTPWDSHCECMHSSTFSQEVFVFKRRNKQILLFSTCNNL